VLCGYGNFGKVMTQALENAALPVTIIDRAPPIDPSHTWIKGDGTGADALRAAGITDAVGIVAATANDVNNLSSVVTARELNPRLFTVLRQNHVSNRALFAAFESDFVMVPSEIVAHECLAILTTPLLAPFLDAVRRADDAWSQHLLDALTQRFGWDVPAVWSITVNIAQAPSIYRLLMRHESLHLGQLLRTPVTDRPPLACSTLLLLREGDEPRLLPDAEQDIRLGDQLLLVGRESARKDLDLTLFNGHTLDFVLTGRDAPSGLIWEKLRSHT